MASEPATAQRAVSTLIGEVLTAVTPAGTSGAELVVLRDNPNLNVAGSRIFVYPQVAGGGLGASQSRAIGDYDNPTQAAISDVNGDGRPEVLVALAGSWSKANNPSPPGVFTLRVQANNANIDGNSRFDAAGSESAGSGANLAWIAIADLGTIGKSKHADGAGAAHVSTETANFARHVECVDCHNSHEATVTPQPAPRVKGPMKGSWGVSVLNDPPGLITYTEKPFVDYEYEVCLKCHGTWAASGRTRDIASEVDTRNASVHAVEETSTASQATAGSFVTSSTVWSNDSVLHCTDCHGNADAAQPAGPHISASAPLLNAQYVGLSPTSTTMLCYTCHRYDVYCDGTADGLAASNSLFYTGALGTRRLHSEHVLTHSVSCSACHDSHGSAREHLMRGDVGFTHNATGGACANGCHTGGASHAYTRP